MSQADPALLEWLLRIAGGDVRVPSSEGTATEDPMRVALRAVCEAWAREREAVAAQTAMRMQDEAAAFEREARIFAVHSDAIAILNSAAEITRANARFVELTGHPARDLVGKPLARLMPTLVPPGGSLARLAEGPAPHSLSCPVLRADGTPVQASVSVSTVNVASQVEFVLVVRDLTEVQKRLAAEAAVQAERAKADELQGLLGQLERANQELAASRRQLMHADRLAAIGQMAAGVAHEINNPAAFVVTNLELAAEEHARILETLDPGTPQHEATMESVGELGELLEQCVVGVERIRAITRDLNAFSRIERDELEPVDVNALLRLASRMVANQLRPRGRLEFQLGKIPAIEGDKGKLAQVMINLLVNAAQALEETRRESNRVVLRTEVRGDSIRIQISDTGPGIPSAVLPRIFEPFFTTKPRDAGTGLGLSLSAEIIRNHSGTIDVESRPGGGTTFTIDLPTKLESASPRAESSATPSEGRRPGTGGGTGRGAVPLFAS